MGHDPPPELLRDPWLLAVDKPPGLLTQPGLGSHLQDSVITRLRRGEPDLHLVHRLDRDTSGVLLLARGIESLRRCSQLFSSRSVRKLYLADVEGPLMGSGCIDAPLARLNRHPPRYGSHPLGRPARTRWRSAAVHARGSRLWLAPITGRSHQLRAHLAGLGHPIVGDPIYGSRHADASADRMHLHAVSLGFLHPFTGRRCRIDSLNPNRCPFPPI